MQSTAVLPQAKKAKAGLGTFAGVYLPSLLTICGVIMYLRLGLVVGSVGLIGSMLIILLASSITFITSLSIATTATNIRVKGGGAYYLISRSFGKEIGAAVGLPLYLAQSIGIAFYIAGFVASLQPLAPGIPPAYLGLATLTLLTALAYTSASLAIKAQGLILLAVLASLASFFMGTEVSGEVSLVPAIPLPFWATFALFFPAVTGIEAGVAMSGDLRSPSKSLVRGVVLAVVTGLLLYLAMSWHLTKSVPRDLLRNDPFVVEHLARWGWMITMGIWGATLSSGLGALLGAPRTLQALASDGVVPRFLAKGFGPNAEPRMATLTTFALSGLFVLIGRIDIIAPLLTMFFMISYGTLNLAAGLEGLVQNPSWRPTFRIPTLIPIIGSALCIMAMLMINPGVSMLAFVLVLGVYLISMRRSLAKGWDDIRQGILILCSRIAIYRLSGKPVSARSWRPNFLVLTNGYSAPQSLLSFTSRITKGKGFLTVASIFSRAGQQINLSQAKGRIDELFRRKRVEALVTVCQKQDPLAAMENLIENYGMGPLRPNTIVIGDAHSGENRSSIARIILHAQAQTRNVIVMVGDSEGDFLKEAIDQKDKSTIDIWWDDDQKANSELMLVLAHMHQHTKGSDKLRINVKCTVRTEAARANRQAFFEQFFANSRFNVATQVYVSDGEEEEAQLMSHFSATAGLAFCGLRPAKEGEDVESYTTYYRHLLKSHRKLHNLVYILATESTDLTELFK